ncbi:NAD-dependent protein deacetylase sirtuin-2 [Latimeria chalumnae]|uniref:NAD-dependent protein deacetylase sirtuin-2 n=1 Tax=Latimeria chalumnae TaxID=7897 RepID=UPI0006D8E016|nr:PREDICTED: NAD-dependent protein deacetylase sirtuin-2 [Latimeria chalumnae]|eukprot:XP_014348996.1 PREDICTED: NAD-dependent protein deacetylase sirtuin-2 [Latimeria chalumnae]
MAEAEESDLHSKQKEAAAISDSQDSDSEDELSGAFGRSEMEFLQSLLSRTLNLGNGEKPEKVLDELTLEGVARFIQSDKCKNIICIVGAGISTSAGIPDFRSPSTGIYANLQKYNLPCPEAMFEISYFKQCPEPFFALVKELYPGRFKPAVPHYFMRMLLEKGQLLRCYTQNIDTLERVAGIPEEQLVEAHGTFYTSHCVSAPCRKEYSLEWMKDKIFSDQVPRCEKCSSVVKPDIVFFGEGLPPKFFTSMATDFPKCDLLIIMGTSLQVEPFASLIHKVHHNTPRLLINKEKTGQTNTLMGVLGFRSAMDFDSEQAYRDVAWLGTCDDGCLALAELLGWKKELEETMKKEHAVIDSGTQTGTASASHPPAEKPDASLEK